MDNKKLLDSLRYTSATTDALIQADELVDILILKRLQVVAIEELKTILNDEVEND